MVELVDVDIDEESPAEESVCAAFLEYASDGAGVEAEGFGESRGVEEFVGFIQYMAQDGAA